jgi:hypothetical protein
MDNRIIELQQSVLNSPFNLEKLEELSKLLSHCMKELDEIQDKVEFVRDLLIKKAGELGVTETANFSIEDRNMPPKLVSIYGMEDAPKMLENKLIGLLPINYLKVSPDYKKVMDTDNEAVLDFMVANNLTVFSKQIKVLKKK